MRDSRVDSLSQKILRAVIDVIGEKLSLHDSFGIEKLDRTDFIMGGKKPMYQWWNVSSSDILWIPEQVS